MSNQRTVPGLDDAATLDASGTAEPRARRTDSGHELQPGAPIGRYVVIAIAGHGGMGVVYRAYDPELQREVALKLLRGSTSSAVAGARLRREAQAMAKVSHPNVLPIYDVGELDGRVWIAMELLPAPTLETWLRTEPRRWREIVAMFVQAGRGVAAAHAAGLVHRDFKPHNVLVGPDGRARVMDFGLARSSSTDSIDGGTSAAPTESSVDLDLTAAGSIVGTPRYMAPEQHHGRAIDGRADQFAFCVALFESLYRVRAFAGDSVHQIAVRKQSRHVTAVDAQHDVPARVHRILLRGLAPDPAERFATMDELLAALEDDPTARRRRWIVAGSMVALLVGGSVTVGALWSARARPCQDAARKLEGVWDDTRRASVDAAMRATGLTYADEVAARTGDLLDGYTARWITAHNAACAATEIHGEQSVALLDLRIACLDRARTELGALVDVLEQTDATVLDQALQAAAALRPIEQCDASHDLAVRAHVSDDPDDIAELARLEGALAYGSALGAAGKPKEAAALLEAAVRDARTLGISALLAEMLSAYAVAVAGLGDHAQARDIAIEALGVAMAEGAQRTVVVVLTDLAYLDGYNLGAPKRGREWAQLAQGLLARHADESLAIRLLDARTVTEIADSQLELGQQLADEAIARQRALDPTSPWLADLVGNFGAVLAERGHYESARVYLEQALELHVSHYGIDHPSTLRVRSNLGAIDLVEGRTGAAIELLSAVAEAQVRVLGERHPDVANTLTNLATAHRRRGENAQAIAVHRRVLAVREAAEGPMSLQLARTLENLSIALRWSGELAEARAHHARAQRIREALLPPEHLDLAQGLVNEIELCRAEGNLECAHASASKALELRARKLGPTHTLTIASRVQLAQVLDDRGDRAAALAELESLLVAVEGQDVPDATVGNAMFELAKLVPDRARARELATTARSLIDGAGDDTGLLASVDAWLASND